MGILKVGDKVRVKDDYNWRGTFHNHYGDFAIITSIGEDRVCWFEDNPHPELVYQYVFPSQLELYVEPPYTENDIVPQVIKL